MKKRPVVALINTTENTGAQVITNATSREWSVVKTSAGKENLLGPFRYGSGVRVEYFDSVAEVRQIVAIGASTSKETIVANTIYKVKIGNSNNSYESTRQQPVVFSTLFGTVVSAAADRKTVYDALVDKINAYDGLNVVAYTLTSAAFTAGTSSGNAATTFIVGEVVTQETSSETARVAKCDITSGTFYGDDAAGNIYLFDLSSESAWLETAKTLTAAGTSATTTNCVVTATNATTVHSTGIVIEDNAGYFTSNIQRGGISSVFVGDNFATDTPVVTLTGVYGMGIGTAMLAQKPVFDPSNQDLISGSLEHDIQNGDWPTAGKTYCKCVIVTSDGDEESLGATKEDAERESILFFDETTADYVADVKVALTAAIAL